MRCQTRTGAVLLALIAAGWASGGEPPCSEPRPTTPVVAGPPVVAWSGDPVVAWSPDHATTGGLACFLRQLGPVGGWDPYGGGLLAGGLRIASPAAAVRMTIAASHSLPHAGRPTRLTTSGGPRRFVLLNAIASRPAGKRIRSCAMRH